MLTEYLRKDLDWYNIKFCSISTLQLIILGFCEKYIIGSNVFVLHSELVSHHRQRIKYTHLLSVLSLAWASKVTLYLFVCVWRSRQVPSLYFSVRAHAIAAYKESNIDYSPLLDILGFMDLPESITASKKFTEYNDHYIINRSRKSNKLRWTKIRE